jgi:class 3 adenylate cyclase
VSRRQIVSMLFSDVKDYSKIKDDNLYRSLEDFCNEFQRQHLNEDNHFLCKTWGDAFFICSYDPVDIAEIALNLRDKFRNETWRRMGISLSVRIGLHAEKVEILSENNGEVKDVVGQNVNTTARIEPIVDPDHIFCSEMFHKLSNEPHFRFVPLGQKQLAKNFGEMELYELLRANEPVTSTREPARPSRVTIPQVKVRKEFTDKDLQDFLRASFQTISDYFQEALQLLEQQDSDIETDFQSIDTEKFRCHVYVRGKRRGQCQIWVSDTFGVSSIHYAQGPHFSDNSYNDSIYVHSDGFNICLQATGFAASMSPKEGRLKTPEEAAEHLWTQFSRTLQH